MREDKISLCITTKDRPDLLLRSYRNIIDDPRIDEIVISYDGVFYPSMHGGDKKFTVWKNENPVGMMANKARAISIAKNPWCIIFDDDNIIDKGYVDALYLMPDWHEDTIVCPSYAAPHFDYTKLIGAYYNKENVHEYFDVENFWLHINTCNYFVHRDTYLKSYKFNPDIKAADTIWFAYNWLKDGNYFYVNYHQQYIHSIHEGSGWKQNVEENRKKFKEIEELIRDLR